MTAAAKRYRIEECVPLEAPGATAGLPNDERVDLILSTVQELRALFDPAQRLAADVVEAYRRELREVYQLRAELDAMKEAITSTKREVATLHRSECEGKGMRRVAGELDAVVGATEEATTTILAAVEEIETQANMMRSAGMRTSSNDSIGAILDRVVVTYEACNFQDLTGQRISKIVGVLKFVEERLDRMIHVWGGLEAFKDMVEQNTVSADADDDTALLNGPRLAEDEGHVEQSDIDALFD